MVNIIFYVSNIILAPFSPTIFLLPAQFMFIKIFFITLSFLLKHLTRASFLSPSINFDAKRNKASLFFAE